jgi:hypothetical protein
MGEIVRANRRSGNRPIDRSCRLGHLPAQRLPQLCLGVKTTEVHRGRAFAMPVETASLDTVMRDAKTTWERRAATAVGSKNPCVKFGLSAFDPGLGVSLPLAVGVAALRCSEPPVFCQHNSKSTRNIYSSRIPRNTLKITVGAASYPQLKQGVFAPLNLTDFAPLPRIRDRVEYAAGKIA